MTGAATMTEFTPTAEGRLADYLAQVRQALHAHPDVSPDEVEADVREHIATEFARLSRPVTLSELETVLTRLGPPTQWAHAGATSQVPPRIEPFDWRAFAAGVRRRVLGVFNTLWKGPEDWRLAYLTFGLTLLAIPTVGLTLIVAWFFGRAAVELSKEKGEPLGARRWLTYPAILAIVFPLLSVLLFALPIVAARVSAEVVHTARSWEGRNWQRETVVLEEQPGPVARGKPPLMKSTRVMTPITDRERHAHEQVLAVVRQFPGSDDVQEVLFIGFAFVGGLAGWWTILGLIFWAFPKWPTTFFHPLLDGYDGRHGARLAAVAGVALFIWGGFAYRLWDAAHPG